MFSKTTNMERISVCVLAFLIHLSFAVAGSDRVKLTELKTITLYSGRLTNGRRSAPIPQLKCVGGSAGCSVFVPKVVQCYNRGSDGYDVQWECKTDMDNDYRFGSVEVLCEGYDYPNDPYILRGSCGLEYTIDFTKGGSQQKYSHNYGSNYFRSGKGTTLGDIIILIVIFIIIYAIIKTCLYRNQHTTTSDDYPSPPNDGYFSGGFFSSRSSYTGQSSPPPPGFRTDYGGADCGTSTRSPGSSSGGGGFWTGALTGGLLGYMFGNRNNAYGGSSYQYPRYSRYQEPTSFSSGFSSSETRTASGFGGTRRR
ncbi:store-operated calcium entry-associated regulatory factor-like [Centruroides sculpturatus]|uniref:store-operated calcium entry-associated regulatory factor-like n=1 Tax=Centruroides sculpturatus TaxID=218467 RepID=UPI000C6DA68A|nr:store-operated calcium entry-associated regulatory factor-like [Centruroides sculpturatus]